MQSYRLVEFRVYQDPKEPTFLGFLFVISFFPSLKKVGYLGLRESLGFREVTLDSGCWPASVSMSSCVGMSSPATGDLGFRV